MRINTRIIAYSTTPNRKNPATYSQDRDTRFIEENTRLPQMNEMSDEMNALADGIDAVAKIVEQNALQVSIDKSAADTAKNTAVSAKDEAVLAEKSATNAKNIIESWGISEQTALDLTEMTDIVNSMDSRVTLNELATRRELYREFDLI